MLENKLKLENMMKEEKVRNMTPNQQRVFNLQRQMDDLNSQFRDERHRLDVLKKFIKYKQPNL